MKYQKRDEYTDWTKGMLIDDKEEEISILLDQLGRIESWT